jgi:hypothetical protein
VRRALSARRTFVKKSTKRHLQQQHHGKTEHGPESGEVGVLAGLQLGDEFLP